MGANHLMNCPPKGWTGVQVYVVSSFGWLFNACINKPEQCAKTESFKNIYITLFKQKMNGVLS